MTTRERHRVRLFDDTVFHGEVVASLAASNARRDAEKGAIAELRVLGFPED